MAAAPRRARRWPRRWWLFHPLDPAALTPLQVRFVWHELPCYHCFWLCTQPHAAGASYPCLAAVSLAQVRDAAEELLALRSDKAGTMIELR